MSRNPFDDVGKPRGGTPQSFQAATAAADQTVKKFKEKVKNASLQVPDLITGEAYDLLEPRSIELVHQDLLDDARFKDLEYRHLVTLPTHQERERAARSLNRRGAHLCDSPEFTVEKVEAEVHNEQTETRIVGAFWAFSIIMFFCGLASDGGFLGGVVCGFAGWGIAAIIWRIYTMFCGIGSVSGKAV